MLEVDPQSSGGWALSRVQAEPHCVHAHYARSGEAPVELFLRHPEHASERSVNTERFSIDCGGPGVPEALLAAVQAQVAEGESGFVWHVPRPDEQGRVSAPPRLGFAEIERLAFQAGAKPALRAYVTAQEAGTLADELTDQGYHCAEFVSLLPRRRLLFVARSQHVANRLSQLETVLSRDGLYRSRHCIDAVREIGLLLGYPACCVRRFVERYRNSPHPILPRARAFAYLAARAASVPQPHYLLNDLLGATGACYVSFEPCRYDCPVALEVARATADAVAAYDRELRTRIDDSLACDVLILGSGERGVVELDSLRIIRAIHPVAAPGGVVRRRRPLAAFHGGQVRDDGTVAGASDAMVLSFGRRIAEQ